MMDIIKSIVECDSLYGVIALFILCTLLRFVSWLCYKVIIEVKKLIQYIVNKITKYKEIHAKAQYKDALLKVDLTEQNEEGIE